LRTAGATVLELPPAVRDEGYNGESVAPPDEPLETEDLIRLAMDAAEIGTWNWHIASGRVEWTPWTYQLFGYQPGGVAASYELFMRQVHAADRPAVKEWIAYAIHQRRRTTFEFRIDRADGSVRWIRSTGRAILGVDGRAVRMVGVVEDVTDERYGRRVLAANPAPAPGGASLSARQVAHILGIADAGVKRLVEAGHLKLLRSTRKNSRRFAPGDIIEYLRRGSTAVIDFVAAAEAQDMSGCLIYLMEQFLRGASLEALLDGRVQAAARVSSAPFMRDLLSRLPFIVPERQRTGFPTLFVQVGASKPPDAELIVCLLRSHGHEILRPAGVLEPTQIGELAERVRARLLVLAIGSGPTEVQANGVSTSAAIAAARHGATTVCVWCDDRVRVPRGIIRFRSMGELASVLSCF
jgi:PAS domain S-box-containing protein